MKFYNYLSRKVEEFDKSEDETVGLYTCGPTVYDYVHIGNWRTFIFEDILKRILEFGGCKVNHVMNLTDIDDKIIKKANAEVIPINELTQKYSEAFFEDLSQLNIKKANTYPKATEHIKEMISLISKLVDRGVAYEKDDSVLGPQSNGRGPQGSVYFSIAKFSEYGKLSGPNIKGVKAGARVDVDEYDKDNPQDFVLWKASGEKAKDRNEAFDSPWGIGRPGWHIECSAMSMKYLGETFDIHAGGVDLLFPHHENEIAQSEAATGKKFVDFWMEGEHLLVNGEKMAKRLGNIITLSDIAKRGFDPLALRYLFLTAHYRSKLNFTWESLDAAQKALNNLRDQVSNWDEAKVGCAEFDQKFKEACENDLDMPKALSVMWELVKSDYPGSAKHKSILKMDEVLGLGISGLKKAELPQGAKELIEKREEARENGDFEESDKLRKELMDLGVVVEDTKDGPKWRVKND